MPPITSKQFCIKNNLCNPVRLSLRQVYRRVVKVQALAERSAMCSGLFSYSEYAIHIDNNIACSNLSLGPQPWTIVPLCYLLEEHKTKSASAPECSQCQHWARLHHQTDRMHKEIRQCSTAKQPAESMGQQLHFYQKIPGIHNSNLEERVSPLGVHRRYNLRLHFKGYYCLLCLCF